MYLNKEQFNHRYWSDKYLNNKYLNKSLNIKSLNAKKRYGVMALVSLVGIMTATPSFALWDTKDPHRFAGDVIQLAIPLTGAGVALAQNDTEGLKQWAYTVGGTAVITQGVKYGFSGTSLGLRPDGSDRYSFVSGHASNACAGATFIGQRYGWQYGTAAMLPAGYVAWTRVNAKKHHPRDVIAGCAVGVATGLLLTEPKDGTAVTPWYENETMGVTIRSVW